MMEWIIFAKELVVRMSSKHTWYVIITSVLLYVYIDIKRDILLDFYQHSFDVGDAVHGLVHIQH